MLSELKFDGEIALVTGAAAGIGLATCQALAELGARLVMVDVDAPGLEAAAAQLRSAGAQVDTKVVDMSDAADISELCTALSGEIGSLKALVNVAGSNDRLPIQEATLQTWDAMFRLNVTSMFLLTQGLLPLLTAGEDASITNVGSTLGLIGNPRTTAYAASKAAIVGLTRQLAVDLSRQGHAVRVNAVCPGPTLSPRRMNAFDARVLNAGAHERQTLVGRQAEASEVGNVIAFLASDAASFMTGSVVVVDGGQTAHTGTIEDTAEHSER